MKETFSIHDFIFILRVPEAWTAAGVAERLRVAGCGSVLVGLDQPGSLLLDFSRPASVTLWAVLEALRQVRAALPGVELLAVQGACPLPSVDELWRRTA